MASPIEYLTVYNAHTGLLLRIPKPLRLHTLPEFKNYLLEHFTNYIVGSTDNIFLLTAFGIKFDFSAVASISEVYMFDKRLFVQGNYEQIYQKYLHLAELQPHELLQPKPYESANSSDKNVRVLSKLKVIDGWTRALVQNSHQINERMDQYIRQTNAIFMSLNIIFEFTTNYIRDIRKYHENHQNHIQLLNMKTLHKLWKSHYNALKKFPEFHLRSAPRDPIKLSTFLDENELASSAAYVGRLLPEVLDKFNSFSEEVSRVTREQLHIDKTIELLRNDSITHFKDYEATKSTYVAEVEKLGIEITSENNTTNSDQVYSVQVDRSSRLFASVDNRFKLLQSIYDFKCKLGRECILLFERMGSLQKSMVEVRNEIKGLTVERVGDLPIFNRLSGDEKLDNLTIARIQIAEDHLSMPIDFPLLFGLMMIEKRRQYEWHNFFLKGVVHNSSEQLTMIIKHEKDFQKLWVRKYSGLVRFLDRNNAFRIQLPSVDISVVNGQPVSRQDSILAIFGDADIDREDITQYIQMIRNQKIENNTADTLTKNFDSLTVSTENLKHITKIVATLSSFASPNNLKLKLQDDNGRASGDKSFGVENDSDLNVINGLRSRIRCLESLLHQRQYQELLSWPVLKNSGGRSPDNRQSMLLLAPSQSNVGRSVSESHRPSLIRRSASLKTQASEGNAPKVLDASVTIDKHLDNIRLRRENSELNLSNALLVKENENLKSQLEFLKKEMETRDREHLATKASYEEKLAITQTTVEELGNRHEEELQKLESAKQEEISKIKKENSTLETEISALKVDIDHLQKSIKDQENNNSRADELDQEISNLSAELSDLKITNSELSSTIDGLKTELSAQNSEHEKKVRDLNVQLEDNLKRNEEVAKSTANELLSLAAVLHLLNGIIVELFKHIEQLVAQNMEYFKEFCFVLESMGLLLVSDDGDNHELKITRVKGLKTKKGTESLDEKTFVGRTTPHSEIYPQILELANWSKTLVEKSDALKESRSSETEKSGNHDRIVSEQLLELFEDYFKDKEAMSSFSKFARAIAFTDNVQLQAHYSDVEVINQKFFLNGISKRFLDVEGFAKKLTKENKQKALELAKYVELCKSKITLSNFSPGDLVLFLPIRIEDAKDENDEPTPWTAFNIDSPHYLLDPHSSQVNASKEWIVNRVELIAEHRVTQETLHDKHQNPFALEVGHVWFMIYTA